MLKSPCVLAQHVSLSCKYFSLRQVTNMTVAKIKHISFCINCFPLILSVDTASKKKKKSAQLLRPVLSPFSCAVSGCR